MTILIIISLLIGFVIGRILGYLREYNSIDELEEYSRTIINELNKEIEGLRKQINESNTQVL